MSTAEQDQLIVIHPPLNGDVQAIADVIHDDEVTTVILAEPLELEAAAAPTPPATFRPVIAEPKVVMDRAVGVDAFRGFFLLLMTFAMAIPNVRGMFPDWMYHHQEPLGQFVDRAGISWRDLTFPAFLFTMCAAIPITNSLRLAKGMPYPGIIWGAVKRFFLLTVYALIIGNITPYWTNDYTKRGNLVAIAGFLAMWPLFTRKPEGMDENKFRIIKRIGWVAAAAIIFLLPRAYGNQFSLTRSDDIIRALAFVSLVTIPTWLFTRNRPGVRLAVFAAALAFKIAGDVPGPLQTYILNLNSGTILEPWMFELLVIAIPGTFAGDLITRWMRATGDSNAVMWSRTRLWALAGMCFAFAPLAVVGFYNHADTATAVAITALVGGGLWLCRSALTERERILRSMFYLAAALMVTGAWAVQFGGIKKDPATVSYLLFTAGLSLSLLMSATLLVDVLKPAKRVTRALVETGQNPLLAYVCFMLFTNNIIWLTNAGQTLFETTAAMALLGCTIVTAATAVIAITATRHKLFWRA